MRGKIQSPLSEANSGALVGYIPLHKASSETYRQMGFKCGLEIHQQLKTAKKLFCRCPAGIYQQAEDYNAEIIRHMRPTLSELGEYDGTALMEFKTRKNITYRLKNENACTYEIDDTPPFPINREALSIAIEIALLLKSSIVGELHITRKQYLDGSIPTGFQRTAIVSVEGYIPLPAKNIRMIQLSIEEDSCREVSDIGHERIYTTDRLGMPLIEMVTAPEMLNPQEAAAAAHFLRFLARSTGKVRTGIGAARQDVNVSISGGTRVEIKGVAHISRIPRLTHNEAFRQRALLEIKKILGKRIKSVEEWQMAYCKVNAQNPVIASLATQANKDDGTCFYAVNLPDFVGLLSFFTQPGKCFSDEISDRLKVIACLEKPNLRHHEEKESVIDWGKLRRENKWKQTDAQLLISGQPEDLHTALETIEERCRLAFFGVPNETRKSLKDGTTIFERVLPGPDRMYPDTDSAPLPISETLIEELRRQLPTAVENSVQMMQQWQFPQDVVGYILKNNLFPLVKKNITDFNLQPVFVATFFGHNLKHIEGWITPASQFDYERIYALFAFLRQENLQPELAKKMLPVIYHYPNMDFESVLLTIAFKKHSDDDILALIPDLKTKFKDIGRKDDAAMREWMMGQLRSRAIGNIALKALWEILDGGCDE